VCSLRAYLHWACNCNGRVRLGPTVRLAPTCSGTTYSTQECSLCLFPPCLCSLPKLGCLCDVKHAGWLPCCMHGGRRCTAVKRSARASRKSRGRRCSRSGGSRCGHEGKTHTRKHGCLLLEQWCLCASACVSAAAFAAVHQPCHTLAAASNEGPRGPACEMLLTERC